MIPRKCRYQFNVEELVFSNHLDVVWGDVGLHCSLWSMHVSVFKNYAYYDDDQANGAFF